MASLQKAHWSYRRQEPGELRHLRKIGLFPENRLYRIESTSHKVERHVQRVLASLLRIKQGRHRMVISDEIEGLAFLLKLDGGLHHSKVIADVKGARRLDTGQNSHVVF